MIAPAKDLATLSVPPETIRIEDDAEKRQVAEFFNMTLEDFGTLLSRLGFDRRTPFPWTIETHHIAEFLLTQATIVATAGSCQRKHGKGRPPIRRPRQAFYTK